MRILHCLLTLPLLLAVGSAMAKSIPPTYDAALIKETEAFLKATDKVLLNRNDGHDLKRRADHSRWGQDLKKRSAVFVGNGTDREQFESRFRPCQMAVHHAVEMWINRLDYDSRPTKMNYDFIGRYEREYQAEMKECRSAKP